METTGPSQLSMPPWKKAYYWFCGYDYDGRAAEQAEWMKGHLESLASLKQTRKQRFILNFNLVVILIIGTFVYVFFSIALQYL